MQRDPATRGTAVILFGATEGPNFPTMASRLLGMVVAIVGIIDALTDAGGGPSR